MSQHLRNAAVFLQLFAALTQCANLNYSGEAITTRFWDCCKPSCGWRGKADFNNPVESCTADDKPTDVNAGTGCNGGGAYQCSEQQPWVINDTMAYGYAGVFIEQALTGSRTEDAWCCACYQLDFTSDPLIGKSMIIQASNTAYDITNANRFTLAVSRLYYLLLDAKLSHFRYRVVTPHPWMHAPGNMAWSSPFSATTWSASARATTVKSYPRT